MGQMVMLILDRRDAVYTVLENWEEIGCPGITLFNARGVGRREPRTRYRELPPMVSMKTLLHSDEEENYVLFSVVEDDEMVDRLIARTEDLLGDMTEPNKGVLFVLPVTRIVGMRKRPPHSDDPR